MDMSNSSMFFVGLVYALLYVHQLILQGFGNASWPQKQLYASNRHGQLAQRRGKCGEGVFEYTQIPGNAMSVTDDINRSCCCRRDAPQR